jgi:hypothetical protein
MVCFLVKEPVDLGVNCGVGGFDEKTDYRWTWIAVARTLLRQDSRREDAPTSGQPNVR